MNVRLAPYSEYKDSGLPWLGRIPQGWDLWRGKFIFHYKKELNLKGSNTNVLSLTLRGVVNNDPDDPEGLVPKDYASYQVFRKGDLVFKLIDLENFRTSRVGLVHQDGIMSPAYIRLSLANEGNIRYFYYQFFDLYLRGVFNQLGAGVRATLGPYDLLNLGIVLPPMGEQAMIVRYLDSQDRRINRLILAKRRLIDLLNEQKQAVIHRTLTCGLSPNVRIKSSGIEWLGDVPDHWGVVGAKRVTQVFVPQRDKPELNEVDGIPWITLESTGKKYVKHRHLFVDPQEASRAGARTVPALSVIASCVGRFGIASINETPVIINQQLQAFIPRPSIDKCFLRYCVQVAKPYFDMAGNSTTLAYVDRKGFQCMPLLLPPLVEQQEIASFIEDQEARYDQAIAEINREIELIREYRTRLIADVVTGKLDVRGLEMPVTDEAEASDLLEIGEDTEANEMTDTEEITNGDEQ